MTLTCCQDHILTENIWFVWSETSYSGDERRCYRCGTNDDERTISEDRATQPMEAGDWVSQYDNLSRIFYIFLTASGEGGGANPSGQPDRFFTVFFLTPSLTGWTNLLVIFLFLLSIIHNLATPCKVAGVAYNSFWTPLLCYILCMSNWA